MYYFNSYPGKFLRTFLIIVIALALLLPFNLSVSADGPEEELQMAPLNPIFLKYVEEQSIREEYLNELYLLGVDVSSLRNIDYGYFPTLMDLGHLAVNYESQNNSVAASLPSTFDWRTEQKVTPVKDQGNAGTCWAFGTESSLESRIMIVDNEEYDLSELNLITGIDPSWVYYNSNRSKAGANSIIATDTLAKMGTRSESAQPYGDPSNAYNTVNSATCDRSTPPLQKVTDFRIVTEYGTSDAEVTKIKNAIYEYGPASAAYYENGQPHANNIYDLPSDPGYIPNHMITIVGWNDSISHPSDGGHGAWIIKNSWGTDWGDSGYFYLCYGAANLMEVGSYHGSDGYKKYDPNEKIYYWDEAGPVAVIGAGDYTYWMRSVFTAESSRSLKAIAFWTTADNASYQVNIFDANEKKLSSFSGICGELGYYTIPLTVPVSLSQGQTFKVDVKMITPGYKFPVAVERVVIQGGTTYCQPLIQPNATFVKHRDSDRWIDTSTLTGTGISPCNICLRAITGIADPSVTTQKATSIGAYSATLNGTLVGKGGSWNVSAYFRYGTSTAYGSDTPPVILNEEKGFSFTLPIADPLAPRTTYHFQAVARGDYDGAATVYGSDITFKTSAIVLPSVTTRPATDVAYTGATLNGRLIRPGAATRVTVHFEYGPDKSYGLTTAEEVMEQAGYFSAATANLTAGKIYHCRVVSVGDYPSASPIYGRDIIFKTKSYTSPGITTGRATGITKTGATLNGNLTRPGSAGNVSLYFEYGLDKNYGPSTTPLSRNSKGTFSSPIPATLSPGTIYYFRAVACGDYPGAAPVFGRDLTFKTVALAPPAISSITALVKPSQVTLRAYLSKTGSSTTGIDVHFEYWLAGGTHSSTPIQHLEAKGYFSAMLNVPEDLAPDTFYNYLVVASGEDGTATSAFKTFKTRP
jgi:C1A family cysteine protease